MFQWLRKLAAGPRVAAIRERAMGLFSTQGAAAYDRGRSLELRAILDFPQAKRTPMALGQRGELVATMDAQDGADSVKVPYNDGNCGVPDAQVYWYAAQGFIGYQMMALLAQHWLVEKACAMPGRDAVRKGFEITANDGTKLDTAVLSYIRKRDTDYGLNAHMIEFLKMGREFGIRIVKFDVTSSDPDYYEKPFNIDGVTPGSYKGMIQIDPIWVTPLLVSKESVTPGTSRFYKPDFWMVGGQKIHYTHLVIFTTGNVADVLKPSYFYGGISVTQKIYERVYASERTANEAPMLAMTKRLTVMKTDLEEALANQSKFEDRMNWQTSVRDNYGTRFIGPDDALEQHDLTLTDLDNVIMTQYQLVAAIAEVPGTKLLGTQPKGFNSTGEFEESSYHETLESYQSNDIEPLVTRHHLLVCRSEVQPKFGLPPTMMVEIKWNELDAMTAQEQAAVNLVKAQTDGALIVTGAIDSQTVLNRIVNDPDSGYNGLSDVLPPMPDQPEPPVAPPASTPKATAEKGA